jgi:hypothetical protein
MLQRKPTELKDCMPVETEPKLLERDLYLLLCMTQGCPVASVSQERCSWLSLHDSDAANSTISHPALGSDLRACQAEVGSTWRSERRLGCV